MIFFVEFTEFTNPRTCAHARGLLYSEESRKYGVEKPICKLDRAHRELFSGMQERQVIDRILLQALATYNKWDCC